MIEKRNENMAAVYVRDFSVLKEKQENTLEQQKALCFEKAIMEGLEIDSAYVYEDKSSEISLMNREAIKQLIKDAEEGRFSTVIIPSLSRISRDGFDTVTLKRILVNGLGIRLISIEENFDSHIKDDELIFAIMSAAIQNNLTIEEVAKKITSSMVNNNK